MSLRADRSTWLCRFLWLLIGIVIIKGGYDFFWRLWLEWNGARNDDSGVYWAVGRGITNGLTVYRDLFEIKPPMIFLISALSYWLTDTMIVGHVLQGLVILGVTLTVLAAMHRVVDRRKESDRMLGLSLLAIAGAIALGLYVGARAGTFQTESFGAFFACCYLLTIVLGRTKPTWVTMLLASIFYGAAVMTKEPFALTAGLGALLIVRTRQEFLKLVIIPGLGAVVFSLALLWILGGLDLYSTVYLHYLVGTRVQRFGSPWARGLWAGHLLRDLRIGSPLLAVFVPSLWISWLLCKVHETRQRTVVLWTIVVFLAVGYGAVYAAGLSGEFLGHHCVFAVPIFAGLLIATVESLADASDRTANRLTTILGACAALAVLLMPTVDAKAMIDAQHIYDARTGSVVLAKELDDVLTACGRKRYLMVGEPGTDPFAFTRHSPLGPGFFQFSVIMTEQWFLDGYADALRHTDVLVDRPGIGRAPIDEIRAYINGTFSYQPWPCAEPHVKEGLGIFRFRINAPLTGSGTSVGS